jgi:hypothetical protein
MTRNDDRTAESGSAQGAVDRWEHERASGRTRFILRRGVLNWGIPAAFLTVVYKFVQEQGLVWSPRMTDSLRTAIVVAVIVFPVCGWIFGRWLWDTGETRYKARVRGDVSRPSGR